MALGKRSATDNNQIAHKVCPEGKEKLFSTAPPVMTKGETKSSAPPKMFTLKGQENV